MERIFVHKKLLHKYPTLATGHAIFVHKGDFGNKYISRWWDRWDPKAAEAATPGLHSKVLSTGSYWSKPSFATKAGVEMITFAMG